MYTLWFILLGMFLRFIYIDVNNSLIFDYCIQFCSKYTDRPQFIHSSTAKLDVSNYFALTIDASIKNLKCR